MRVKVFSAPTVAQAMEEIRHTMGAQAIIISSRGGSNGVHAEVMAAVQGPPDDAHNNTNSGGNTKQRAGANGGRFPLEHPFPAHDDGEGASDIASFLRQSLRHHGTPSRLCDRLVEIAQHLNTDDPALALAGALDALLKFHPFPVFCPSSAGSAFLPGRVWMMVGPPGAGKTVSLAKLAAGAALKGRPVAMMTTDTARAGGTAQLEKFAQIMGTRAQALPTIDDLRTALNGPDPALHETFIDTQSVNPFDPDEADHLEELIAAAAPAHRVLVMAAGGDALESADIGLAFARLGAKSLLFTRLDMTARLGGVLASAYASALPLIALADTPQVAHALSPITPLSLARLILPDANEKETTSGDTGIIEAIS